MKQETSQWGKAVKKAVIDHDMTLKQLAEKIGYSNATVSQVVNGRYSNSSYKVIAEKINEGYKAYGGEWLVLPVVMIVGYFVNEARMYLPDFIEEWREEKAYERRVAENRRRVQRERNSHLR